MRSVSVWSSQRLLTGKATCTGLIRLVSQGSVKCTNRLVPFIPTAQVALHLVLAKKGECWPRKEISSERFLHEESGNTRNS